MTTRTAAGPTKSQREVLTLLAQGWNLRTTHGAPDAMLEQRSTDGTVLVARMISMSRVNLLIKNNWLTLVAAPAGGGTYATYFSISNQGRLALS